jgi:hypothetical protein
VTGDSNAAVGDSAGGFVTGSRNAAVGSNAGGSVTGDSNAAFGDNAGSFVTGSKNAAVGFVAGNNVTGDSNSALGDHAGLSVTGNNNVAIGMSAGNFIQASNTVAIGTNAVAKADGGVAIGNGATASRPNQVVLGTSDYTYTMPGITSTASRAVQTGPVQLLTTDAAGNLASDGGLIQSQINALGHRDRQLTDGIAIAVALAQPIFQPGQNFAVRAGWGNFDGGNAVAVTAAGVVGRGYLGPASSIVVDGGVGVSTDQGMVAGRAGLTFGW